MRPILFSIGNFHVYGYGLMIGLGLIIAVTLAEQSAEKKGLNKDTIFPFLLTCIVGGVIGGKGLYWITIIKEIMNSPKIILNFTNGFVVYGSIIGAILFGYGYCKVKKLNILDYLDLCIPYGALAQGFGRIGCFFAGCCYGMKYDGILSVTFPHGGLAPVGIPLLPTQLISSGLNFLHFAFLLYISKKTKHKGQVFSIYLICYSIGRFILEYFRGDLERGSVGMFSTSQFISIFILVCGVGTYYLFSKSKKNEDLL